MAPTQEPPSFDDIIQAGELSCLETRYRAARKTDRHPRTATQKSGGSGQRNIWQGKKNKLASIWRTGKACCCEQPRQPNFQGSFHFKPTWHERLTCSQPGQRSHSSSPVLSAKVQAAISRDADLFSGARSSRKNLSEASNATGNSKLQNGKNVVGKDFSIRGAAGPYVVVGSNFAPGTTAADIQSAMEAITGEMLSCNIITSYPTVIAEMVFADKACAETVISTFNNQRVLNSAVLLSWNIC